jgi:hypothetical protein
MRSFFSEIKGLGNNVAASDSMRSGTSPQGHIGTGTMVIGAGTIFIVGITVDAGSVLARTVAPGIQQVLPLKTRDFACPPDKMKSAGPLKAPRP